MVTRVDQGPEGLAAQQMQVQVVDLLAAVRIAIDDEAVAAFGDPLLTGEVARHDDHVADRVTSSSSSDVVGVGMGLFGTIKMCTGAAGRMSKNAMTRESR